MKIFEPSNSNWRALEDAIHEVVAKAKETRQEYSFDCNGLLMIIDPKSDADLLIKEYQLKCHERKVADGTIKTATVNMFGISGN